MKKQQIIDAIRKLHSDKTRSLQEIFDDIEDIGAEADGILDCLREEIEP